MKILFASSEAVPFIKSGGLADVAGSLTAALRKRMHACRVVMPLYDNIPQEYKDKMKLIASFYVPLSWRSQYCGVFEATHDGVKFYFIDNEYYFKRHGLYGFFDDAERFGFFSKALLEMIQHIGWEPEIIHCNDWQTGLVPVYLNVFYRHLDAYKNIRTVFMIHNIQYQGKYALSVVRDVLGLTDSAVEVAEYDGDCNFMKAGIDQCDMLTTVSPTYAAEILNPWFSYGLDNVLGYHSDKLSGILNGIDTSLYNSETDPRIAKAFSADDLSGKAQCKSALQKSLGLEENPDAMIIAMVTRLVAPKGIDLVCEVFSKIMEMNTQFVMLGSGDWQYEKFFRETAISYPGRISVTIGFDVPLSHNIYSGADVFLMPSRSEPCGLSQIISLRYGTLPIVRITGGLNDSIREFGAEGGGNGYNFPNIDSQDMLNAIVRAYTDFRDKDGWQDKMKAAMACDFGWKKSAGEYIKMYKKLLG
ncbi:MAG: glycogen synthase GlgA [Oscillospiraceae bacterium]|nr:glycogen synthase GlgA [Oscillospiraceae bacterium]